MQVSKIDDDLVSFHHGSWVDFTVCTGFGCAPYTEIENDFVILFVIDAVIFADAAVIIAIAWRRRPRAKKIV
jgi:hypothetical protein